MPDMPSWLEDLFKELHEKKFLHSLEPDWLRVLWEGPPKEEDVTGDLMSDPLFGAAVFKTHMAARLGGWKVIYEADPETSIPPFGKTFQTSLRPSSIQAKGVNAHGHLQLWFVGTFEVMQGLNTTVPETTWDDDQIYVTPAQEPATVFYDVYRDIVSPGAPDQPFVSLKITDILARELDVPPGWTSPARIPATIHDFEVWKSRPLV